MDKEEAQLIYAFPRTPGEEIQIAVKKFKGKYYVDLRLWFQDKKDREFHPTKKGVFFSVERIPDLQKGVDRLSKAAERFVHPPVQQGWRGGEE